MSLPITFDKSGVLIEKIGDDENFSLSNVYLPNKKGVIAVHDIQTLEREFLDIARNPEISKDQMKRMRPKEPNYGENITPDEKEDLDNEYRKQLKEYETMMSALDRQVSPSDMFAIKEFLKPFWLAVHMTPAIKGRRFHAFTKDPLQEQKKGLFGGGPKE